MPSFWQPKYLERLDLHGGQCLGAREIDCENLWKNGDGVFFVWVCFNDLYLDDLSRKMRIDCDSAHFYSGSTAPEHRGMGIAPTAWRR